MKSLRGIVVMLILAVGAGSTMFAQNGASDTALDQAKLTQLQRMAKAIDLNSVILAKFKEGLTENLKGTDAGMPDGFMDSFADRLVERFDVNDFLKQVIAPVLNSYFTVDELSMIADFLESDLGKRLITAKMNDEEIDVEKMMSDGEISDADGMKMMQLMLKLGKKKDLLDKGNIQQEIEERGRIFGQALAMDVLSEMMEDYSEDYSEDSTQEVEN